MSEQIKFFTPINIPCSNNKILCNSRILTLGSCFSDHMGSRLSNHLFNAMVNPFGTIFNPISIAKVLDLAINEIVIEEKDLHQEGNRFFHYDFHSSFDSSSPQKVVDKINQAIKNVRDFIQNMDFLILTFGTSIAYKLKESKRLVSNCHKVPNYHFDKVFLSVDIMEENTKTSIAAINKLNPSVNVICTVSPVRHTKEGLIENSLSKSRLIELCHRLKHTEPSVSYFPSYEIMIDELRDYRYYSSDLIHPNDLAIDIIWSRFMNTYFDKQATQKVQDIKELIATKNHIPFDSESQEHLKFKQSQLIRIERLSQCYPEADFGEFEDFFKQ